MRNPVIPRLWQSLRKQLIDPKEISAGRVRTPAIFDGYLDSMKGGKYMGNVDYRGETGDPFEKLQYVMQCM